MNRVEVIQYKKEEILSINLSGLSEKDTGQLKEIIDHSEKVIRSPDNKSGILILTDVTGSRMKLDGISLIGAYVKDNKFYVKASAIVGAGDSLTFVKKVIEKESGRVFPSHFSTKEEACDWLVAQ